MTPTQLRDMPLLELLTFSRAFANRGQTISDIVISELADRLDAYPFTTEPHPTAQQELPA